MSERKQTALIRYLNKFRQLSPEQVLLIEANCEMMHVSRGEWLLREGDTCKYLYFLTQGMVRTVVDQDDDITVWVTLPDHFLTSTYSYVQQKPSIVGLQAITRSSLIRIPRKTAKILYQEIPVLKDIALSVINEYYIDLERLYIFCLKHSASQRYAELHACFPDHFFKVPLKYLASMIHVKPETLSRIRRTQLNNGNNLLSSTG